MLNTKLIPLSEQYSMQLFIPLGNIYLMHSILHVLAQFMEIKSGHTFEGCDELKDPAAIQKAYIQLWFAVQRLKEMGKQTNQNVNSLKTCILSYPNSFRPIQSANKESPPRGNLSSSLSLDKRISNNLERLMKISMTASH